MTRQRGEGLLLGLAERLSAPTLRIVYRTLNGACAEAVELGLLPTNPMAGLLKRLRLNRNTKRESEDVKAMDRQQAGKFLATASAKFFPVFHTLIEGGLRIGELLALEWPDINLDARTVSISKTTTRLDQVIGPTKTKATRTVDLSADLLVTLKAHALASGCREGFVFLPERSRHTVRHQIEQAMFKTLQRAGLPAHFTPHSLRHTFASILLSEGVPITYVQAQLGHSTIQQTVDTYGSWLPQQGRWVDSLRLTVTNGNKIAQKA